MAGVFRFSRSQTTWAGSAGVAYGVVELTGGGDRKGRRVLRESGVREERPVRQVRQDPQAMALLTR